MIVLITRATGFILWSSRVINSFFRLRVLFKLKFLKHLDAQEVTKAERAEADKKGDLLKVARPDPSQVNWIFLVAFLTLFL